MNGDAAHSAQYPALQAGLAGISAVLLFTMAGCADETSPRDEVIECRSPDGVRETRTIPRWKYDRVREEILNVVPAGETVRFTDVREQVAAAVNQTDQMLIGNLSWYVGIVVLEMETAGELERVPDSATPLPGSVRRAE